MPSSPKLSPPADKTSPEDPDTAAARKELKQTAISEKPDLSAMRETTPATQAVPLISTSRDNTPDGETGGTTTRKQAQSPRKKTKRLHDDLDDSQDTAADKSTERDVSPVDTNGSTSLSRADRSEPEKKRPRDVSNESKPDSNQATEPIESEKSTKTTDNAEESETQKGETSVAKGAAKSNGGTSTSAFQNSSFASFAASSASPFASSGGTKTLTSFASLSSSNTPSLSGSSKPSIFGSTNAASNGSGFGSISAASSPFGGSGGASPFGTVGSNTTFGNSSGSKLKAFGQPGESFKSGKPARAFGAPASEDENDENADEDDDSSSENDRDVPESDEVGSKKSGETDEKKKTKLQRVAVDDGETGEATLFQVRAKIFHLDKATNSWKERGAGNLKLNVPIPCVDIDEDTGAAIPGSFDASMLDSSDGKVVRLVMRQDSTHRILLNTAVIPAMDFQEKSSLKATFVLFTALEDGGPINIHLKMTSANAQTFIEEVKKVQHELQSA
ncbi:hypothetical protein F5Y18DRAFT_426583 [Xylariaceae sp. FL1019]|nr:hypothetical protein F5Y18DRAFT_426583 [Xylariaceae sp. FL1019]